MNDGKTMLSEITLIEYLTVVALVVGPVLAVIVTRFIDKKGMRIIESGKYSAF